MYGFIMQLAVLSSSWCFSVFTIEAHIWNNWCIYSYRCIPNQEFVEQYIKAYYLSEQQLSQWMKEHNVSGVQLHLALAWYVCICR